MALRETPDEIRLRLARLDDLFSVAGVDPSAADVTPEDMARVMALILERARAKPLAV